MTQNKLFWQTRWRLAGSYALVMGSILFFCGIGLNRAIAQAYWQTLNRELESVAGTWHDNLESNLDSSLGLETAAQQIFPSSGRQRHLVGAIYRGDYYIRLLNPSEALVTAFGIQTPKLPVTSGKVTWQTIEDAQGDRYRQISIPMHAQGHIFVGYLQMGRSLAQFDRNLAQMQFILGLGIAISTVLATLSSWWLSKLAMEPIYRSYSQIQQFTADAAHELRTPLATISATVESALRVPELTWEENQILLSTLKDQNQRLTTLVTDLLLLSRIDRQEVSLSFQPCCLNDIVSDLVEELAGVALTNQIHLAADIRLDRLVYVSGDESQLYRLVSNLIANALQYTPNGGEVKTILSVRDSCAEIQIKDTGVGIPLEAQPHIFERFYRINSDRSRHFGGAGLGLAIAKAIAQNHGGNLQVSSHLGKGSTFTLSLPLVREPDAQF
ncbi:two-component system sensor histidine kinase RppB [Merismopedia glauca]|uniref:histidine kinase n=1 Tax=Merismopedia glauca CCAP 1448/3 TaxID=1296344 RepID=A0A2T1C7C3_9CYAN|nr:two-component system sensor histidine kinase RppB [Merismopedia glauca]PSB04185.1 two-component sensor histidine kinase [Merismopedia glauca CCAP 1448/3]